MLKACIIASTIAVSSLAAFGAVELTSSLGPEIATIACIAAFITSFFMLDRPAD